jgi:hypothetical protein
MDTDADQHPRNTDQGAAMVMEIDQVRVTTDTAHRPTATMVTEQAAATVMDMDQGRETTDTAHRSTATMVTDRGAATAMDTDRDTATMAHRPALTMDTAHRPVTAMEKAQDLATIMDTDQGCVTMDTVHRPVTDAPLVRQPIRQTLMRLSRSRHRTYPRLLLVNNDQLARAPSASARPASL